MYALIRDKDGTFYGSTVFALLTKKSLFNLDRTHYCIVLNREKNAFAVMYLYKNRIKGIRKDVIIVDEDQSGWNMDRNYFGYSDLLGNKKNLKNKNILKRCIEADNAYIYEEYHEIHTNKDREDFYSATGILHDGIIQSVTSDEITDCLIVYFTDTWGCDVEIVFSGEPEYNLGDLDPEKGNLCYWFSCSVFMNDDYIYLVSEDLNDISELED